MIAILEFINNFKEGFDKLELEKCFTQGNCYHFSIILKNSYPKSKIYYDCVVGHFFVLFENRYYDITGEIEPNLNNCQRFEYIKETDPVYYDRLIEQCGYKYYRGE